MSDKSSGAQGAYSVTEGEGQLSIQHAQFGADGKQHAWEAVAVDPNYLLVSRSKVSVAGGDGYGFLPIAAFRDFLLGLAKSGWSGAVRVDCVGFQKKLFFRQGKLCFASSQLIDDRLGERLYRTARITIDQLVESASQVDRNRKFGQVLIQSSLMTASELWEALKDQVLDIFRSVFFTDSARFVIEEGEHKAFMEVVFDVPTERLVNESFSSACMVRDFVSSLSPNATILVNEEMSQHEQDGTFHFDMLQMIRETANVKELLSKSKLRAHNTLAAVLDLVNKGMCYVEGQHPDHGRSIKDISPSLNAKIDMYSLLLRHAKQAFSGGSLHFPVKDLRHFAWRLNDVNDSAFSLDENGEVHVHCRNNIFSQCQSNSERVGHFENVVEALIHFLLQLALDVAPQEIASDIRKKFREMA